MSEQDSLNEDNFRVFVAAFIEQNNLTVRKVAKAITCSEATLSRLIADKTRPTSEMLRQVAIMIELGWKSYSKLSKAEKEKISEAIGTVGGGVLGFGVVTAAVSSLGAVLGLSAAGITSGLATLGAVVGGGMAAGILVAASIPIAVGALGYGVIKSVKALIQNANLDQEHYDPFWEKPLEEK